MSAAKAAVATRRKTQRTGPLVELRRGPSKKRADGPPDPRLSLHKKRAAWFRARVSWPLREAPLGRVVAERRRARRLPAAPLAAGWQLAGPTNIGGRCTAIVCDPADADRVWIGAAGGGVWASTDAGRSWRQRWPRSAPLQIGTLAIDPSDSKILYCGTGEANLSADSYPGDGIYRSVNGGRSWKRWAPSSRQGLSRRIGSIAVDPFDPAHVLAGGVGYGRQSADNDLGGLFTTRDGGASWTRESFVSTGNYWCHQVLFDPRQRGLVLATVTGPGVRSGIYRSADGGASWTQLGDGLPSADRIGRTTLALAPSEPGVLYALCADATPDRADAVLGVFKSIDGGDHWRSIGGSHFADEGQMSYGNTIAVHPQDANHLICGGVDLHLSTNGGRIWRHATHWDATRGAADYAHADHHRLLMPAAAPGRVYSANDGGLDVSDDGGSSWSNRSAGLAVTMYYDIDVAQTDARVFGGGAQDNGTLVTRTGRPDDSFELLGGDGGWMVIDPRDASHIYASYQFGGMYRFRGGSTRKVSPPFRPDDSGGIWMVYITIDPGNSDIVYTGNQRLYQTRNDGDSWDALTPVLDGSPISAIEVAVADPRCIYVGTENGGFFASTDRGRHWSANLADGTLPGVSLTRIATDPRDAAMVFVTSANFGNSHVFRSADGGATWSDVDRGRLPDVPHHALLVRPDAPDELYVCNDAGVYLSPDGGTSWFNASGRLPHTMVVDLVYQRATQTLLAATYGRSIWRLQLE